MPPKKKKGEDDKKKKQKRKAGSAVDAAKLMKEIVRDYDIMCEKQATSVCLSVRRAMRNAMEEDKVLHKFVFDPNDRREVVLKDDEELTEDYFAVLRGEKEPPPPSKKETAKSKRQLEVEKKPLVKLKPLLEILRSKRYVHIQTLMVWNMYMDHDDMMTLAAMVGGGPYPFETIELMDCFIHPYSITRFAPFVAVSRTLVELNLDFNEFGDEGCHGLCEGLRRTRYLLSLSLCYCELTKISGVFLGRLLAETPIRNIYLDGNHLEAEGTIALLDNLIQAAQEEKQERDDLVMKKQQAALEAAEKAKRRDFDTTEEEQAMSEPGEQVGKDGKKKKKKKGKRSGKKGGKKGKKSRAGTSTPPPPAGPQIEKLHLADNGIDHMGRGGNFAPMRCMQLIRVLIMCSKSLQEIDLWGNDIGDLGSRQLLDGLQNRKLEKLPQIGLRIGHRINPETFDAISKLAPGVKKKKRRAKKKK